MRSLIGLPLALLLSHGITAFRISPRADCDFIQIEPAQGCDTLAARCNVTVSTLEEYNPGDSLCTTLRIGQRVCCTAGELPPIEANPDGTCREITVEDGDNCDAMAAECDISLPELLEFNNGGTDFCGGLRGGQRLCCTPGELAEDEAESGSDASCEEHVVEDGESCASIAEDLGLSTWEALEGFNEEKTEGWEGCDKLLPGMVICVGEGDEPEPGSEE